MSLSENGVALALSRLSGRSPCELCNTCRCINKAPLFDTCHATSGRAHITLHDILVPCRVGRRRLSLQCRARSLLCWADGGLLGQCPCAFGLTPSHAGPKRFSLRCWACSLPCWGHAVLGRRPCSIGLVPCCAGLWGGWGASCLFFHSAWPLTYFHWIR